MKVLLKEDVDNLGYAGEVHSVANGYGRNYLIPQGMAVVATPKVMKQAEAWRRQADARRAELRAEYDELSKRIEEVNLTFSARAGDTGKLYGSVTTAQIADDLNEQLGTDIDRRKVGNEPLRQLGVHKVVVRLSPDHRPEFSVTILPEGGTLADLEELAERQAAEELAAEVEEVEEEVEEFVAEIDEAEAEFDDADDEFEDDFDDAFEDEDDDDE